MFWTRDGAVKNASYCIVASPWFASIVVDIYIIWTKIYHNTVWRMSVDAIKNIYYDV